MPPQRRIPARRRRFCKLVAYRAGEDETYITYVEYDLQDVMVMCQFAEHVRRRFDGESNACVDQYGLREREVDTLVAYGGCDRRDLCISKMGRIRREQMLNFIACPTCHAKWMKVFFDPQPDEVAAAESFTCEHRATTH